ncbi:MAG: hypothetical protein MUC47_07450 [Candidatus Kapabacteria bacterium]|nr:hypothetical protein [Candidatus Kapabacteria bacterium]
MNMVVTNIAAIALLFVTAHWLQAQVRIAGQVNFHAAVLGIDSCRNLVVLDRGLGPAFKTGDRILLHQAYGVVLDTALPNDNSVVDRADAGKHQFTAVASVRGDTLVLSDEVTRFSSTDGLQCIRVIQAATAVIQPTATVVPWNGRSGGIAVIECTDTLTLDGRLSASGCGFRGGSVSVNAAFDNVSDGNVDEQSGRSAPKGESAARLIVGNAGGRAPWANGGGGGNGRNTGGGGGALASQGGNGGDQTSEVGRAPLGGQGGRSIVNPIAETRLHFGAGGGGGHQNDNLGSSGGRGGGLIILRAPIIVVTSRGALESNGVDADTALQDGAGGGGAGGTIVLDVDSVIGVLTITARGGNGGHVLSEFACYGPGGGGSGGVIATPTTARLDVRTLTSVVAGGSSGRAVSPPRDCPSDLNYGATPGEGGYVGTMPALTDYRISRPAPNVKPSDTVVCRGQSAEIAITGGVLVGVQPSSLVQSQSGTGFLTTPIFTDTTFLVTVTSGRSGCFQERLVRIRTQQPDVSRTSLVMDSIICLGQRSRLSLRGMANLNVDISSLRGNVISKLSDSTFDVEGTSVGRDELQLRFADSAGCSVNIRTELIVSDTTPTPPSTEVVLCKDSIELDAGDGYASYRWSTGDTTRRVVVSSPGLYNVTVALPLLCPARADIRVLPFASTMVTLNVSRTVLVGDNDTIVVVPEGAQGTYRWNNGESGDSLRVTNEGLVWVIVTTPEGCTVSSDTIMITRQRLAAQIRLSNVDTIRYKPGDRGMLPLSVRHVVPASRDVIITVVVRVSLGSLVPDQRRSIEISDGARIVDELISINGLSGFAEVHMDVWMPQDQQVATILVPYIGVLGTDSVSNISIVSCIPASLDVSCERDADGLVINDAMCREGGLRRFDPKRTLQRLDLIQPGIVAIVGSDEVASIACHDVLGRISPTRYQAEHRRAERLDRSAGMYWWVVRLSSGLILVRQEISSPW